MANNTPKIALGVWAWGNDGTFGSDMSVETLRPIVDTAMQNGLNLWDTAYAYGMGTSEKVLAGFLKGLPRDSYLASDKFTPQCADASSPTAMKDMIEMQQKLMGLDRFDFYWIHNVWEAPKWTEELAKYYEGDLSWMNPLSRSSKEMHNKKSRPALVDRGAKIEDYDMIFLGFPIWWGVAPMIVNTFLESYDFSGKTIVLFATSGGSGLGKTAAGLQASAPGAAIKEGKLLNGTQSAASLKAWADSI